MKNQRELIKQLFKAQPEIWIPLPEIMRYAAQYNARIKELRESGMYIVNKTKNINGTKHSWFLYSPKGQATFI
jgi:hypothetical protein